jgi:hypothetical protein
MFLRMDSGKYLIQVVFSNKFEYFLFLLMHELCLVMQGG